VVPVARAEELGKEFNFQFINSELTYEGMGSPDAENCAPFLKALSDKTRWCIVEQLLSSPRTVSELAERLKVSPYNASKHLRILREAGIIETSKLGKKVECRIVPTFQRSVAKNKKQLNLGCCIFHFGNNCC
jgi:DNA-binding transcriptional ArsR family regulator